ncbi:DNA annealing helicase and endonuclease ZRANB3 isoform X1 [Takifugu rubripes]|uniref:Zinc finger RANBP2-type containing 3 n=1 Tax=Takifugu rubripes TaxID=31033 RepID=H2TZC3_TAKRU|nr:DNA annealing helicase and endonuclease ZRANB3 isoform X1 [Takifugu rubripes]XP_011604467.1 DNA annealing helicase and endonuclease ZRANB3 isoform X1 [Takifugu rubripes]XP_011604469.1 DNA annealing helicase and endonuclease ZRANB3 isoform X1 [Takifugu rubripes]|eukprot:XP_011604466.1 PREDICTED: DNA annealing helicase and endonuclease ZRANB3 isoform X1 [Takifugu rubripes]
MEMDVDGHHQSFDPRWSQQLSGLPHKLLQRLMPFQREGVEFALSKNGRCMIADEMGLGKTVQAIAVASAFRKEWPLLVVVPSSLKYPWIEELERWIPELQPGDINLVENKSHTMGIGSSKVTVLGYGLLTTDARALIEALNRQHFAVVVVDESHYLKSRNAARTKILVPLIHSAKRAVLLTGTPALGRPEELFMQIDALYPKKFGTWSDYAKKYCNAHYKFFGPRRQWDCRGASNLDELHQRLSQIMIRRLKAEVLTQLPPKVRQRIPFDLPKEAAKEASATFAEWEILMKGQRSGVETTENPFTQVMGLVTQMYKQTAVAKAGAVKDYIKMMLEAEKIKFLVFAHHLTMLQACTEAVIEAKAGYIRIDGSVPSSERIQLVHKFQNDPETRVAVLSIQAAGQGLTFTAASHVVFAELYWNPGHIKQAEDRAHRIGQTSSINVHYLIAKGTFDTVMWSMLNRKETVTGSTLNGRKEYLKADEGDKDKWEFLNFADAWTPTEKVLPLQGNTGILKDDVFFTHFEKEKQHDIRSFFSPNASREKKRKRIEDEKSPGSDKNWEDQEQKDEKSYSQSSTPPDQDFSPQVKRLRTPRPSLSPGFRSRGKRQSLAGSGGSGNSSTPDSLTAPRNLSTSDPSPEVWSCGACTYSNSSLLPYCEMCEYPRSSSALKSEPPKPEQPPSAEAYVVLSSSNSEPELSQGKAHPPKSAQDKQSKEEEEEEDKLLKDKQKLGKAEEEEDTRQLKSKQSAGERGDNVAGGGSCLPPDHTHDLRAATCLSPAADANDDEANNEEESSTTKPVYLGLQFCASQYTDRIYLYTKDGAPLSLSFIPLDIKLTNWDDLPKAFSGRKENRIQVLRFVQEWCSLSAMKQKLLRRSGLLFHSPILGLQQQAAAQRSQSSTKRYLSKAEVAQASLSKAQQEGGSVRLVTKEPFSPQRSAAASPPASHSLEKDSCLESPPSSSGYLQAVDSGGVPLCLSCQQACSASGGPWDTRFCSHKCQDDFQMRTSQTYMRSRVLEVEHGTCQHCGLHAHDLFLKVRDAPPSKRKEMLENTWLAQLSVKELNEMIRAPVEGDFWQVDHIQPVYRGGGQCSLDNLQTLCTVCHKARTATQAKERSQMRKSTAASKVASDISRFFIRK